MTNAFTETEMRNVFGPLAEPEFAVRLMRSSAAFEQGIKASKKSVTIEIMEPILILSKWVHAISSLTDQSGLTAYATVDETLGVLAAQFAMRDDAAALHVAAGISLARYALLVPHGNEAVLHWKQSEARRDVQ